MSKSELQQQQEVTPASSLKKVQNVAQAILSELDRVGEIAIEHRDPLSSGLITVQRSGDRVHIRAPRGIRVSMRLMVRKNQVLWGQNKKDFVAFLNKNPLALSFLESVF